MAAIKEQTSATKIYTKSEFEKTPVSKTDQTSLSESFFASAKKTKAAVSFIFYNLQTQTLWAAQQPADPNNAKKLEAKGLTLEDAAKAKDGFLALPGGGVEEADLGEGAFDTITNAASRELREENEKISDLIFEEDLEDAFYIPNAGFKHFPVATIAIPVTEALQQKLENFESKPEYGKTSRFVQISMKELSEAQKAKDEEYATLFSDLPEKVGDFIFENQEYLTPDLTKALKKEFGEEVFSRSSKAIGNYCVSRATPKDLSFNLSGELLEKVQASRAFYSSLVKMENKPPMLHYVARTAAPFCDYLLGRVQPLESLEEKSN